MAQEIEQDAFHCNDFHRCCVLIGGCLINTFKQHCFPCIPVSRQPWPSSINNYIGDTGPSLLSHCHLYLSISSRLHVRWSAKGLDDNLAVQVKVKGWNLCSGIKPMVLSAASGPACLVPLMGFNNRLFCQRVCS